MGNATYSQIGSANDVTTLNQDEQSTRQSALQGVLNTSNSYENLLRSLNAGLGSYESGITSAASNYDPTAASNQLMNMSGSLQNIANTAAQSALSGYNQSATDYANTATQDALRATASQLAASGLTNSGAAQASLMEAALAPQQQLATNMAQLQSQYSGNALNNLLSQTGSSLSSGYSQLGSQNYNAATTNAANYLNSMGLQSSALANQGSLYNQLANTTQQQYYTPQYSKDRDWTDWVTMFNNYVNSQAQSAAALLGAVKKRGG